MSIVQPTTTSGYPDRSTRLVVLGVCQLLMGGLCGLIVAMLLAVNWLGPMEQPPQGRGLSRPGLIQAVAVYLPIGVAFIWVGIGLIRARRWAWTLTVVLSWTWLIVGVLSFAGVMLVMGRMRGAIAEQARMPPAAVMAMSISMGAILACMYVLLPGFFLVLCQHESVRATCRRLDPKVPWTDRCPMPVLALSLLLGFSVISMFSLVGYGCVVPLFGVFLTGAKGAAVIALTVVLLAYLAWGTYRLQMAAWWGSLLLVIAGTANMVVMFARGDLTKMYEMMKMPADQVEMMRKMGLFELMSRWGPWMGAVGGAAWLVYLLYVRRYFARNGESMAA